MILDSQASPQCFEICTFVLKNHFAITINVYLPSRTLFPTLSVLLVVILNGSTG